MAWHFWQYIYMYQYYSCGGLSIDVVSVLTEEWDQRRTTSSFSSPTFHPRCWRPACQESPRLPWSSQGWMWPVIPSQSSPQYTTTWEEHPPTTKDRSVVNITKKSLIHVFVVAHCLQGFLVPLNHLLTTSTNFDAWSLFINHSSQFLKLFPHHLYQTGNLHRLV